MDQLAWLPLPDALQRLDYQGDAYAIDALQAMADSDVSGSPVLLVRNARTVPARRWTGPQGDRPLDIRGQEQAEALRRALPAFEPSHHYLSTKGIIRSQPSTTARATRLVDTP